jgi:hypothetical protein
VNSPDPLPSLMRLIAAGDPKALQVLAAWPALATAKAATGATRQDPNSYFLAGSGYVYAGHTALHVAAGAYQTEIIAALIALGADVRAKNRRGSEPLHEAAAGQPGSGHWAPAAQATAIAQLILAGADPNARNMEGATPLHRAVRTRCASAVAALLEGGADPGLPNKAGSTPLRLATLTTGRGGSGLSAAKARQAEIISLLEQA